MLLWKEQVCPSTREVGVMTDSDNRKGTRGDRGRRGVDRAADQLEPVVEAREGTRESVTETHRGSGSGPLDGDTIAAERDESADRRDFDAAVHQWMHGPSDADPVAAGTHGSMDRVASTDDTRAAELERSGEMAAPPMPTRSTAVTRQQAIDSTVENIDSASRGAEAAVECVLCHRAAPHPASAEFLQWDPTSDDADSMICPNCLTHDEETAAEQTAERVVHVAVSQGTRIHESTGPGNTPHTAHTA
jgi:hypothetical protein